MQTTAIEAELERLARESGSPLEDIMAREERAHQVRQLLDRRARFAPAIERPAAQVDTRALEQIVDLVDGVPADLLTRSTRVGDGAHLLPPAVQAGLNVRSLLRKLAATALADARAKNEAAASALAHAKREVREIDSALKALAEG